MRLVRIFFPLLAERRDEEEERWGGGEEGGQEFARDEFELCIVDMRRSPPFLLALSIILTYIYSLDCKRARVMCRLNDMEKTIWKEAERLAIEERKGGVKKEGVKGGGQVLSLVRKKKNERKKVSEFLVKFPIKRSVPRRLNNFSFLSLLDFLFPPPPNLFVSHALVFLPPPKLAKPGRGREGKVTLYTSFEVTDNCVN